VPDGGVNILASNGRTPSGHGLPPHAPKYMGRFWSHRVGAVRTKTSLGGSG
jgi:hypothetical protein